MRDREHVDEAHRSTTERHEYRRAFGRVDPAIITKASARIGASCSEVIRGWIYGDNRSTFGADPRREQTQIDRSVTHPDHVGLADECVEGTRPLWQVGEMILRPRMDLVVLGVGEGSAIERDNPHPHARLVEVLLEQRRLFIGVTPPPGDFRGSQPGSQ
jgi:hypothetical protein